MNATSTFLCRHGIDPYIRGFRQSYFKHSDLGYFVDLRPIGSTVHLWTAFVGLVIIQQSIRLLSADFTELLTGQFSLTPASRSIKGAFQGVTPSFHLSDNQFADCDSSLPFYQRLTFSVRNKSHYSTRSTPDDLSMYASARRKCLAGNTDCSSDKYRQCRWRHTLR